MRWCVAGWGRSVLVLGLVLGLAACGGGEGDDGLETYQATAYAGTLSGGLSGSLNFTAEDKYGNLSGTATVDGQIYCLRGTREDDTVDLALTGSAGQGRISAQMNGEALRGQWTLTLDGQTRGGTAVATEAAAISPDAESCATAIH